MRKPLFDMSASVFCILCSATVRGRKRFVHAGRALRISSCFSQPIFSLSPLKNREGILFFPSYLHLIIFSVSCRLSSAWRARVIVNLADMRYMRSFHQQGEADSQMNVDEVQLVSFPG